jgi:hypothetical protein
MLRLNGAPGARQSVPINDALPPVRLVSKRSVVWKHVFTDDRLDRFRIQNNPFGFFLVGFCAAAIH